MQVDLMASAIYDELLGKGEFGGIRPSLTRLRLATPGAP
jgi:hypothetical protein